MARHSSDSNIISSMDDTNDRENHFIIRFPPEIATKVKHFVEQDKHQTGSERLSISFDQNLRTGYVHFEQNSMHFTLYDLPGIIEVMKTLDNKTIYKIVDLSQMIVASPPGFGEKSQKRSHKIEESLDESGDSKQEKYQWPHGLCPPLKNVRRKRFRKIKRKKYMDVADVERELKRLLRADLEATSVRWEVVSATEMEETERKPTTLENNEQDDVTLQQAIEDPYEYGLSLSESDEDEQSNF